MKSVTTETSGVECQAPLSLSLARSVRAIFPVFAALSILYTSSVSAQTTPAHVCVVERDDLTGNSIFLENTCENNIDVKGMHNSNLSCDPINASDKIPDDLIGIGNPATVCIEYSSDTLQTAAGFQGCDSVTISLCGQTGLTKVNPLRLPATIVLSDTETLTLTEGGASKDFSVSLGGPTPTSNVTVSLTTGAFRAFTLSPTSLTFTPQNYKRAQTVTATATEDENATDDSGTITLSATGYPNVTRAFTVTDITTKGFYVRLNESSTDPLTSLTVTEGGSVTFVVRPNTRPSANMYIAPTSADASITVSPIRLDFHRWGSDHGNAWNGYKTVTVTAAQDADGDDESTSVTLTGKNADYDGLIETVQITVTDDDVPRFDIKPPSLPVAEGGQATFQLRLATQPSASVVVAATSPDSSITIDANPNISGNQDTLPSFRTGDWNVYKTVTVFAAHDDDSDDESFVMNFFASGGGYASVRGTIDLTVTDDDTPSGTIQVTPSSTLTVAEGGSGTFDVSLGGTAPTSNVTVNLTKTNTDVTLSPTSLTFTPQNYGNGQTVTVNAAQDADDTDDTDTITLSASGYTSVTKSVAIDDDEGPRFDIKPTTSLTVAEGGQATFQVRLATQPSANPTVLFSASDSSITIDTLPNQANNQDTIIFRSSGQSTNNATAWSEYHTVTVSAAHDADRDDESFTISLSVPVGGNYVGVTATVNLTITDDDKPSETIVLSDTETLSIDEGGSGTFDVSLSTAPSSDVTVSLTLADTNSDITLSPSPLTFTSSTFGDAQTVTVNAGEDADTANDSDTITLSASGGGFDAPNVTKAVSVTDNDKPSGTIQVTPAGTLSIDEGGSRSFNVRLSAAPNADVTVSLALANANSDISLDKTSLTFTTSTWNQMQTITVSAAEDADTAHESNTITLSATGGIDADDVTKAVSVTDNDTPSGTIQVTPSEPLSIDEGGSGTLSVKLSSAPNADVRVSLALANANSDITLSPTSLTFTVSNFGNTQTVTVSAAEDADATDDSGTINLTASGGITAPPVTKSFTVADNDKPSGTIQVTPTGPLSIDEGGSGDLSVKLSAAPNADVTVSLKKTNSDITLSPTSLTFTVSNFADAQTVTVSAAEDDDATDDSDTITLSATGGIDAADVTKAVSVDDDEVAGTIVLDSTATLEIGEGESKPFTVRLSAAPNSDVTVSLAKTNADITLDKTSLTFTTSNFNAPQTVNVTAGEDDDATNDSDTITLSVDGGGFIASDVTKAVSVDDDEVAGTIVLDSTATLTVDEGGSGTFTVRLSAAPKGSATVSLSKTNDDIGLDKTSLTFDASNYQNPQTVTVSAAQDDDAASESDTITLTATGGIIAPSLTKSVRIADDEAPEGTITTNPAALNITEGTTQSFTVRLSTQPNADVTVTHSTTGDALSFDKTSLTFTPSNWFTDQALIVTAAQDPDITDGSDTITLTATGGIDAPDASLEVSIEDDDLPGGLSLAPSGTLEVIEGRRAVLGVSLTTSPSVESVSVSLSNTNPDLTLSPASLTFTPANWSETQSVTLVAAEDGDIEDDLDTITLSVSGGGNYASVADQSASVRILDSPGEFTLSSRELNLTEGGDSLDLQVRLDTRPVGTSIVTVSFAADRSGLDISPSVLIFPADRWNAPRSVAVRAVDDFNSSDERTTITATAVGGNYRSVQQTTMALVEDDDDESTALPPVKSQALAFPPTGAQDSATMRLRCKQSSPCEVVLDCHAQNDGSTFQGNLPEAIPAWGTSSLTAEDIESYTGASWAGKGRLGCALRSHATIGSQVWTRSGDGVLVNNSAFLPSAPEGREHRADIESIPAPDSAEKTNLRIRCLAPEGSDCTAVRFACYDDEGMRHDGEIGTIERLSVRHIQTMEIAERIDHRWQGMGLTCEMRSSTPFTVQVLTRTGGGGALVNNSATGVMRGDRPRNEEDEGEAGE